MTAMVPLVEMTGIRKSFGATAVLDDVSLRLMPGSVHALMGENGAGKSTLMKILAGVHRPDGGSIRLAGREVRIISAGHAIDLGISTVFQELNLLPNLSIAENMFLGREPVDGLGRPDRRRMRATTMAALTELGLSLDPDMLVSELTIADRQFVEIAHGIKTDAQVFILDEPTAALNAADVEKLNAQIRRLAGAGKAIVYISHRMDEIFTICDSVTVLKDGRHVATRSLDGMTKSDLIALMVGRELRDMFPPRGISGGAPVLTLEGIRLAAGAAPVDLTLHGGEILALAGLEGQGQQTLVRAIIGAAPVMSGRVTVKGRTFDLPAPPGALRRMQRLGVAFVPEDRKDEGLFLSFGSGMNIAIGLHALRPAAAVARGLTGVVRRTMTALRVKAASTDSPVGALSGGNQQKVLLGRSMASRADILLIEEPTRGVDVGAKAEIYALLRDHADRGGAVLVLSRETIELIGLADRILVMHGQTVVADMAAAEATEHRILDAALNA